MKRIYLTAMALAALALAIPGMASAQHSSRHDARNARSHHRRHHHHARQITFAADHKTTTTTTPSAPSKTTTQPMPGSGDVAGTVTSFEGGVLKITLSDNSVVSGKVTERTEISCAMPQAGNDEDNDAQDVNDNDDNGDDNGGQENQGDGHDGGGFSHHGDDEHGGMTPPAGEVPVCGTSALVPGAKVHEAELSISSAGAVWEKVELTQ
jgi:hypothetical protein